MLHTLAFSVYRRVLEQPKPGSPGEIRKLRGSRRGLRPRQIKVSREVSLGQLSFTAPIKTSPTRDLEIQVGEAILMRPG